MRELRERGASRMQGSEQSEGEFFKGHCIGIENYSIS
jgi:hypothetical protein